MNKLNKTANILILFTLLVSLVSACAPTSHNADRLVIAVVERDPGTMALPGTQSLYSGVRLAVDEINSRGGINGRLVDVEIHADNGDPAKAAQVARTIISGQALAVIGHDRSETSHAAAAIYDSAGLPIINASPASETLILNCPTYLNISYTAETQAAYMANYLVKVQNITRASIIAATDEYSQALATQFRNTFKGLGGRLATQETILLDQPIGEQVEQIVAEIIALDISGQNPGTLYLVAPDEVSAEVVLQLRRKGVALPIAGANQLNSTDFIEVMGEQSEENAQPGFFTDGILSTRGVIGDSIQGDTRMLIDTYARQYGEHPEDSVLNAYDATLAILAALQRTSLGQTDLAADRELVRQGLLNLGTSQSLLRGATGNLVFGQDRHAIRPARIAIYQNGNLVSAMTQFEPLGIMPINDTIRQGLETGRMMTVNGEYVNVVNVVYTGLDLIEVTSVDVKASTYVVDFYLWFRYRSNVPEAGTDPENILFTNLAAGESVTLDTPVSEEYIGDTILRTYRVTATFKNDFNFHEYPFDTQRLIVQMRNQTATASEIQYVVDKVGMQYKDEESLLGYWNTNNSAFRTLFGWRPQLASAEQSLLSTNSTLGNPQNFNQINSTDYSLFRVVVELQRSSLDYIVKSLLPLLITLILAYITFFLPLGHSERMGVGSTALLTTAFFHLTLADSLPEIGYTVAMEYLFYASYLMSTLIVLLETWSIRLEKRMEDTEDSNLKDVLNKKRERLGVAGKVVYPIILVIALAFMVLVYDNQVNLAPSVEHKIAYVDNLLLAGSPGETTSSSSSAEQSTSGDVTVLTLTTWRPEDDANIQKLAAEFQAYAADRGYNVTLEHEPIIGINYDSILNTQFNKNTAADLIYVRPFSVDGPIANHLLPLTAFVSSQEFDENRIEPWRNQLGEIYGMPFGGVIQGVYYNKDIFDRLGLKEPQTWQEFLETARVLKEAGVIPIANTLKDNQDSEMFQSLSINYIQGPEGRSLLSSGGLNLCFNGARVTGAFNAIADLREFLPADADEMTSETSKSLFLDGQAGMLFGGSWDLTTFQKASFNWGVFAPPAPTGMETFIILNPDVAIGVNKNSPHREESLLFIEWLTSQQAVDAVAIYLPGFYPLRNLSPSNIARQQETDPFLGISNKYSSDARWVYIDISSQIPRADEIVRYALRDIFRGEITGRQAADRLQAGLAEWYRPAQECLR